jgi:hypothetical protein
MPPDANKHAPTLSRRLPAGPDSPVSSVSPDRCRVLEATARPKAMPPVLFGGYLSATVLYCPPQ